MNRDEILSVLTAHKDTLARRFGIAELAVFGSFARDRATDDSNLDVLVRFDGPIHWERYFGAQFYLEDHLGRPADLVIEKDLLHKVWSQVEREVVNV